MPAKRLAAMHASLAHWFRRCENVKLIKGFSVEVAAEFPDEFFDFVYIDADHTYAAVRADILAWWPKVRSGGVLGGHDFVSFTSKAGARCGVIPAVREMLKRGKFQEITLTRLDPHPSWFTIKP
jgi:hypothetical protein